jgi:predicted nuclease with TOPRIM domain
MENQTIKLSKALQDLITAYEDLQLEKMELQEQVTTLSEEKSALEQKVINLEDTNSKQTTDVTDMLSKIEDILGGSETPSEEATQPATSSAPTITANIETKPAMQNLVQSVEASEVDSEDKIDEDKLQEFMNNLPPKQ